MARHAGGNGSIDIGTVASITIQHNAPNTEFDSPILINGSGVNIEKALKTFVYCNFIQTSFLVKSWGINPDLENSIFYPFFIISVFAKIHENPHSSVQCLD